MTARLALLTLALLAPFACGPGGTEEEQLVDEQTEVTVELATLVEGIDDGESLEAAKPTFKELGERMRTIADRWNALVEAGADEAEMERLASESKELVAATERLKEAFMALMSKPDLMAHMNELAELMKEFGEGFGQ